MIPRSFTTAAAALLILAGGSGLARSADAQTVSVPAAWPESQLRASVPKEETRAPLSIGSSGPTFGRLFNDTMSDIGRLPSKENFALISLGFLAAMAGRPADQPLSDTLSGSLPLEDVFVPGKTVGGAPLQMGGALAAYTIGRFTGHPKVAQVGADLLRAQMVAQVVTTGVKMAVRRTRPDGTQYSFPSGHSSVTFASATILQRHFGWKVGLPAYGIASYVAASRIQEKRHYLSDVVFGAALGIAIGRTATIGRGDARFAVSPMPAPGGGGVSFTWIGPR